MLRRQGSVESDRPGPEEPGHSATFCVALFAAKPFAADGLFGLFEQLALGAHVLVPHNR